MLFPASTVFRGVGVAWLMAFVAVPGLAQTKLDPSFGVGGTLQLDLGPGEAVASGLATRPDGVLLVAGSFTPGGLTPVGFITQLTGNGSIDPTFAGDGTFTADLGVPTFFYGLARQSDGRIVALSNNGPYATVAMRVLRLTPDGVLDETFSDDGVAEVDISDALLPDSVVVQPDGAIVVAASSQGSYSRATSALTVFRLLADGTLDDGFSSGTTAGFATASISSFDTATALALQGDGKIVVVGSTNASAAGNTGVRDFAIARFNTNGALDTSFDGDGLRAIDIGGRDDDALAVLVQPDGRIVIAGNSYINGSRSNCALVRLLADGGLDESFGSGGKATYNLGGLSTCESLTRQADGRLIAAGSWAANIDSVFMVMRVLPDGSPDTTFDDGSSWTWANFTAGADVAFAHVVQGDGRILVAGTLSYSGTGLARFESGGVDTTPDAFTFTDQVNVPRGAVVTSDSIVVTGISAAADITVTGGEYSVDDGAFTSVAGTVVNGSAVRVRHTSSTLPLTATYTTVAIGGITDVFTSTTESLRIRRRPVQRGGAGLP